MIDTTGYDTSEIKERIERHNTQITKEILQSYPINYFHLNTGIYYLKDINIPAEEIISHANIVRCIAKTKLSGVCEYTQDIAMREQHKADTIHSFKRALSQKEFKVYFQPKIHGKDQTLAGAEALVRAPLAMEREKLADVVLSSLRLENRKPDLSDWEAMVESLRNPNKTVKIAIVGKYTQLHDAYLSVVEALKHGGISCRAKVELDWIDSEELTEKNLDQQLHDVDGILVPGGFGNRGTEGMILAAQYARVYKIPYLGICLGMQMAIVEFARHVLGYEDANSIELNPETKHPVIALMPDQEDIEDIGGTLRLGSYPCILAEGSKSYELFGKKEIHERHRHRYEVNNAFRKELQEKGMNIVGTSPDNRIVEMIEIAGHPFYVGTQAHPEFKSRPNHAHPLFRGFIQAAVDYKGN